MGRWVAQGHPSQHGLINEQADESDCCHLDKHMVFLLGRLSKVILVLCDMLSWAPAMFHAM